MEIQTSSILDTLVNISREAGDAILAIYNDEERFQHVDMKANDSPLTLADQAAHELIVERLQKVTPEIPILSEEGRDIPYEERSQWTRFWLVDPLDGTKEFIKRNGEFTVNIALVEDQKVTMGCVYVPVQDLAFFAAKGEGAVVAREGNLGTPVQASTFTMDKEGLRIVCSRSHLTPEVEAYLNKLKQPEKVSMGSSLKFMVLAEGDADIYPRLGPTMEWDTGAAQIILEEAGGSVISEETKEPLLYNKENLLNPFFIAYGDKVGE